MALGWMKEFREFAMRGSVVDLAVGVIIGNEFGKIVNSLVTDVFMPPLSALLGATHFEDLKISLREPVGDVPGAAIRYGAFIQTVVNFLIIAVCIFLMVKAINTLRRAMTTPPTPPEPPTAPRSEVLLEEIRDLLKKQAPSPGTEQEKRE